MTVGNTMLFSFSFSKTYIIYIKKKPVTPSTTHPNNLSNYKI